jgi:hypothetical protein
MSDPERAKYQTEPTVDLTAFVGDAAGEPLPSIVSASEAREAMEGGDL